MNENNFPKRKVKNHWLNTVYQHSFQRFQQLVSIEVCLNIEFNSLLKTNSCFLKSYYTLFSGVRSFVQIKLHSALAKFCICGIIDNMGIQGRLSKAFPRNAISLPIFRISVPELSIIPYISSIPKRQIFRPLR